ncbi:MAG: hypothetical protein GY953_12420, partial [bacterium]|nr:hypothetical protein [bacterium]
MLDALHIPHDVVADWNLRAEFLEPYQLVILPNAGCLTDKQVVAIRQYVERGGTLLATGESSLFDENGSPRDDFGLGDVLGVQVDEPVSNAVQDADRKAPIYIHPGQDKHAILDGLPETELILPGDSTYARARKGRPAAYLITDAGTPGNAPWKRTDRAAVHVNQYGKGKAVYICGSLFARSRHHEIISQGARARRPDGVRWVERLVQNTLRYLAPKAPWRVETSERVWAGLNRQPNRKRHVLHLVNWQTDLPATNVRFAISGDIGAGNRASVVWPEELPLECATRDGWTTFTIAEVGPHVMIVME